ncbi:MAG: amidohydrolase family protein [Planctomycetota bacterium]
MKQKIFLVIILSPILLCKGLWAGDNTNSLAIRAGKIWTITNGVITNGVVIIQNGKIEKVGKDLHIPESMKTLEIPDKNIIPGLIDAHCHLGLSLDIFSEIEETVSPVTADMQIIDAFNPLSEDLKKALSSGVTTISLAPGYKNPIAGQTAIVKLSGDKTNDWLIKRNAGIKFSLGNETLMPDRQPTSRPGLIELIKEELNKSRNYKEGKSDACGKILNRVLEGDLPVYIYCNAVDEIVSAIQIIDEYELKATLVSARQVDEVANMIAERDIPVIYMPSILLSKDKDLKRVGKIAGAGVKITFSSFGPKTHLSDLRTSAIIAAKYGLNRELVLKSLTINAAEILGIGQRLGSIETGKDADLVIVNGDPLELTSSIEMVIINGNIVYQREGK